MTEVYTFDLPITIKFGQGVSKKVGEIAKKRNWEKCLITTDKGIVKAGLLEGITESLDGAGVKYTIFDGVEPNPTDVMVEKATKQLKEEGCDFVVAVGGGSSMDTGKGVALLSTNPGKVQDYELRGDVTPVFKNHLLPLITIPTTAGTGSEVDFCAIITDTKRRFKMSLVQPPLYHGGPYLGASIALVDPALTLTLPPEQTASTGIDALSHAIETYVAKGSTTPVFALAEYAIELVTRNLPLAYADGSNIEAREGMMLASNLAGICLSLASCATIHALAEALGGMYGNVAHGVAIAIFAPPVMEFNRIAALQKFARIACLMGEKVEGLPAREAAKKCIEAVEKLIQDVELPTNLKTIGIKKEDLPAIAERAIQSTDVSANPRTINYEDLLAIAEKVYE